MRARERLRAGLVQDADEIDHGVGAAHQLAQAPAIVDVALDEVDRRQQDQMLAALAAARRHDDLVAGGDQIRDDVPADEARAAQHEDA